MGRLNRDTKAAGVSFVGTVRVAAEPHTVPSINCLKLLDLGCFYEPSCPQGFSPVPSCRADSIPRQNIPTGRDPARCSFPATDWGGILEKEPHFQFHPSLGSRRRFSFVLVKYYPGAGEVLEAWDQCQGVLTPHIPPSHPVTFPARSIPPLEC